MKVVALVGAFSVITNLRMQFGCNFLKHYCGGRGGRQPRAQAARQHLPVPGGARHAAPHHPPGLPRTGPRPGRGGAGQGTNQLQSTFEARTDRKEKHEEKVIEIKKYA